MSNIPGMVVFNRDHKLRQRNRAARRHDFAEFTYIRDHLAAQVVDRLLDIQRNFEVAVDIGCGAGHILKHLPSVGSTKVQNLIQVDSSLEMLKRSLRHKQSAEDCGISSHIVHADEEFLPFADNSVDLVVSSMALHWTNDLPGILIQVNRMLKPDGAFLGVMLGGETLSEVRWMIYSTGRTAARDRAVLTILCWCVVHGRSPIVSSGLPSCSLSKKGQEGSVNICLQSPK